jgi:hypothetical protein
MLPRPPSSNFILHSLKCRSIPSEWRWDAYKAQDGGDIEAGSEDVGMEAQRGLMDGFITWGLQNPAKSQVTSRGFQEHLVKGIIEDDHAYSLGEKPGMKKVFAYLLPQGILAPSHQTVQRDLDVLWEKLNIQLTRELKVRNWVLLTT